MTKKKKTRKRQYVSIPQGEGHYDRVEVKCKARRAVHDGTPHDHPKTGTSHCMACITEDSAPREGGQGWNDWLGELINKLGFLRYRGLTNEQHIRELIGPTWFADAKDRWCVNWTVDGYLERRPHLKARARTHEMLRDDGDGPRWSVVVTKQGVRFNIDHQSFLLNDDYDPEDGWSKDAYYKWYAKQLTVAFKRLMGEA